MRSNEGGAGRGEVIRSSRKLPLVLQVRLLQFTHDYAHVSAQRPLKADCWLRGNCPRRNQSPCPGPRTVSTHT